ncbi:MAG: sulfur carrier protein ThiS [Rhodanobacter sp.]|nr:MAG: sulfur carrier protein ThiS [Rhodanobacter sp.]TAM08436.1 MAG: sulfur carrier protein ThiS [Rhodanobacter sp.]TAM36564.1 MAG: sulfur carrier protein ThiS [Rhodanobacter sp.]
MELFLNGEPRQTRAADLAALLTELGYAEQGVATAVNGRFVPRPERAAVCLAPRDRVEILAPMQGG